MNTSQLKEAKTAIASDLMERGRKALTDKLGNIGTFEFLREVHKMNGGSVDTEDGIPRGGALFSYDVDKREVSLEFSGSIRWLTMDSAEARQFCANILACVDLAEGKRAQA